MTVFYGSIRTLQNMVSQIIEIDTQMTELKRVVDDININEVLGKSVELANRLGQSVQSVNEAMITFGRQGFSQQEVEKLAEVSILLGNISDLTVEEAASNLTAGMKQFGIETENVIEIADKLNEVKLASTYRNIA